MTRILLSLLLATLGLIGSRNLSAGPLSKLRQRGTQRIKTLQPGNTWQASVTKNSKEQRGTAMPSKVNMPPQGFVSLFHGTNLTGWYGWGTQDPNDFKSMSPEEQVDYKKKSIAGGLLNKKGIDVGDHINAHWRVEDNEIVNDGKGLYSQLTKNTETLNS